MRLQLAGQHRKQRIVPQRVVVVEVLISQRQAKDSLANQRGDRMFNQRGIALVDEAARRALDEPNRLVDAPQQQRPGVGRHRPCVETGHHLALFDRCKIK